MKQVTLLVGYLFLLWGGISMIMWLLTGKVNAVDGIDALMYEVVGLLLITKKRD